MVSFSSVGRMQTSSTSSLDRSRLKDIRKLACKPVLPELPFQEAQLGPSQISEVALPGSSGSTRGRCHKTKIIKFGFVVVPLLPIVGKMAKVAGSL